jgi:hypothetical protein
MLRWMSIVWLASAAAAADPSPRDLELIGRAAGAYLAWGRVDERPNVALVLCAAPPPGSPAHGVASRVRRSAAKDAPHDRKLYYLWASDRAAYLDRRRAVPDGFAIVKEAFAAVPAKAPVASAVAPAYGQAPPPVDWVIDDHGERLTTGKRKDLFVMVKLGGDAADTDAGWIYGTVAPDGKVTSAGRVSTCMGCHADQERRLFGVDR